MRHLLNTLFIMTEDVYLALENDNVVVYQDKKVLGRVPLLTLSNIVYFGYKGASPALMGEGSQSCSYGRLCSKEYRPLLSDAAWEIAGAGLWREPGQCGSAQTTIPPG